jgi:hypothetical protein
MINIYEFFHKPELFINTEFDISYAIFLRNFSIQKGYDFVHAESGLNPFVSNHDDCLIDPTLDTDQIRRLFSKNAKFKLIKIGEQNAKSE